jgi:hypothetical protein
VIEASAGDLDEFNRTMRGVVARLQVLIVFVMRILYAGSPAAEEEVLDK